MKREHLSFACESEHLIGTLDHAPGTTGLLIVSGGNETRAGAFSGQAQLAARIANAGYPVFRFDRRGVGDSTGENTSFRHSELDIHTATSCFRENSPQVQRIIGFGICDAATALVLAGGAGFDALILANPWVLDEADAAAPPPPAAIRARYWEKLRNPAEWRRFLTGDITPGKLARGLIAAARPSGKTETALAAELRAGIARFGKPVHILLAERDRTAQIFEANWKRNDPRIARCPDASHAFAEEDSQKWLDNQILTAITEQTG